MHIVAVIMKRIELTIIQYGNFEVICKRPINKTETVQWIYEDFKGGFHKSGTRWEN